MSEKSPTARIVLTTTATANEARTLAHTLVEEHLIACSPCTATKPLSFWYLQSMRAALPILNGSEPA